MRSEIPDRRRSLGLVVGFAGVVALLGIDVRGDAAELLGAGAVILSALGYAGAALLYRRWLSSTPALAVAALMTAISSAAFLGPAAAGLPRQVPSAVRIVALATLGIVSTGVAYWLFYLLIDEAGAATASVITCVMPVVALFLGVGLPGVRLTAGAGGGLILMALCAWLATSQRTPGDVLASVGRRRTRRRGPAFRGTATGKQYQVVAAQGDLDPGARQVRAVRAPGSGWNGDGSVARPDGDPGFKMAGGVTDAAGSSVPLVIRPASYARRQGDTGPWSGHRDRPVRRLGRRTGKGR